MLRKKSLTKQTTFKIISNGAGNFYKVIFFFRWICTPLPLLSVLKENWLFVFLFRPGATLTLEKRSATTDRTGDNNGFFNLRAGYRLTYEYNTTPSRIKGNKAWWWNGGGFLNISHKNNVPFFSLGWGRGGKCRAWHFFPDLGGVLEMWLFLGRFSTGAYGWIGNKKCAYTYIRVYTEHHRHHARKEEMSLELFFLPLYIFFSRRGSRRDLNAIIWEFVRRKFIALLRCCLFHEEKIYRVAPKQQKTQGVTSWRENLTPHLIYYAFQFHFSLIL